MVVGGGWGVGARERIYFMLMYVMLRYCLCVYRESVGGWGGALRGEEGYICLCVYTVSGVLLRGLYRVAGAWPILYDAPSLHQAGSRSYRTNPTYHPSGSGQIACLNTTTPAASQRAQTKAQGRGKLVLGL